LFIVPAHGYYLLTAGKTFSSTSGAYCATISRVRPFSLQIAAYRSTLGRRMRAWVSVPS